MEEINASNNNDPMADPFESWPHDKLVKKLKKTLNQNKQLQLQLESLHGKIDKLKWEKSQLLDQVFDQESKDIQFSSDDSDLSANNGEPDQEIALILEDDPISTVRMMMSPTLLSHGNPSLATVKKSISSPAPPSPSPSPSISSSSLSSQLLHSIPVTVPASIPTATVMATVTTSTSIPTPTSNPSNFSPAIQEFTQASKRVKSTTETEILDSFPIEFGSFTLHSLGMPNVIGGACIGFKSSRILPSIINPSSTCLYTNQILEGGIYEVVCHDVPDKPFRSATATGAWTPILRQINLLKGGGIKVGEELNSINPSYGNINNNNSSGMGMGSLSSMATGQEMFGLSHPKIVKMTTDLERKLTLNNITPASNSNSNNNGTGNGNTSNNGANNNEILSASTLLSLGK